jgi:hypothetical protein
VTWFTDEDEIAANNTRICEATELIGNLTTVYIPHQLGRFRFGTTQYDDETHTLEDFAAVPDLAAGALSDLLSKYSPPHSGVLGLLPSHIPRKTQVIVRWLGSSDLSPLKRIVLVVNSNGDGRGTLGSLHIRRNGSPLL